MNTLTTVAAMAALGLAAAASTQAFAAPAAAAKPAAKAAAFGARDLSGVWFQATGGKFGKDYPWTPEYAAIAAKRKAASDAGNPYQPAGSSCLPRGLVGMLTNGAYPLEIFQTPTKLAIIKENGGVHRIYLNRKHQAPDDLTPLFYGDSVARWEGDVLVVDSISLGATDNIDGQNPHSDVMHVVEKFHRAGPDLLEAELIVDDAKAFTKPISTKVTYKRLPDYEMQEYYCVNERNVSTGDAQVIAGATK